MTSPSSEAELAARLNAEALAAMQKDRDEGKRHVAHVLACDYFAESCLDCAAARRWCES